jgi:hypothetical protein
MSKTFQTVSQLSTVMSSCGVILRGRFSVNGVEYRAEADENLSWLNVIDDDSRCMSFQIDEDKDVIFDSGEYLADSWTDEDWQELTNFVRN